MRNTTNFWHSSEEMWLAASDSLKGDVLDVVAELFSSSNSKSPRISRQVTERLKQHSLLVNVSGSVATFAFDHEDFRKFYLGEALGRALVKGTPTDIRTILQPASLGSEAAESAAHFVCRQGTRVEDVVKDFRPPPPQTARRHLHMENVGLIILRLVDMAGVSDLSLSKMAFPQDSWKGQRLVGVQFEDCYLQPTSMEGTSLSRCKFVRCRADRFELFPSTRVDHTVLEMCNVGSVVLPEQDEQLFEPSAIHSALVDQVHVPRRRATITSCRG